MDVDWSNAKALWVNPPMLDEELLLEQCARLKALNPALRCFVYRNLVKALPWYSSVREKVTNPAYAGWFLKSKVGGPFGNGSFYVPQCDTAFDPPLCSPLYHDLEQTPGFPHGDGSCPGPCDCGGVPCGEFLWDHRNASLRSFIVNEFIAGPNGLGNSNVSGFFLDDGWSNMTDAIAPWMPKTGFCDHSPIGGPTEENWRCIDDMGLTQADTTAITDEWRITNDMVHQVLAGAGAFSWQQFSGWQAPSAAQCSSSLRSICAAGTSWPPFNAAVIQEWTMNGTTSPLPQPALDLAAFLLVRGAHWFLGYGWVGCGVKYDFPDALSLDYGMPSAMCSETAPGSGVFSRAWTKATARVDCNAMAGSIDMLP